MYGWHGRSARSRRIQTTMKNLETLRWIGEVDGHLRLVDQTLLPVQFTEIDCRTVEAVWEAIRTLRVRGAGHRHRRGLWRVRGRADCGRRRPGRILRPLGRSDRISGDQPAHGGQSLLGPGPHEGGGRKAARQVAGESPWPCWPRPWRFTRKTGRCAGRSVATGRNCWPTARGCSLIATPAVRQRPITARRWPCFLRRPSRASGCTSMPTKLAPCCKARG